MRPITPGRLLYLFWHLPLATLARSRREGGPLEQWTDAKNRRAMMAAALKLPPSEPATNAPHEVWFLTGKKYWYQTAFCFWSLQKAADRSLNAVFVDDGSFDPALCAEIHRVFPRSQIVGRNEIHAQLDSSLPVEKFPYLRSQRLTYPHLRKLTDVHAGQTGWRLVLDSDMLFFRRPNILLDWLHHPTGPVHMTDVKDSYGYPADTLRDMAGQEIPPRLNVGVCGLRSDEIDWDQLEHWCATLLQKHGTSYYLEQALVALLLTGGKNLRLDENDYRVMPDENESRQPTAALHHCVDLSRRGYHRFGWRHIFRA